MLIGNIVGYNSADKTNKKYVSVGSVFAQVSNDKEFRLGDFKPANGAWSSSSDSLQVLDPANASTVKTYFYFGEWEDAAPDEVGWYENVSDWNPSNDDTFPIGTAFLGVFSAQDAAFTQSGAVTLGGTTLDFTADADKGITAKKYAMLGNLVPKTIKLGDIVPIEGCWSSSSDSLQVLSNDDAATIKTYFYFGEWEDAAPDEVGWYEDVSDWNPSNDVDVEAGDAWLGVFSALDVKLAFPGALD